MNIPNTFKNRVNSIQLSELDDNFVAVKTAVEGNATSISNLGTSLGVTNNAIANLQNDFDTLTTTVYGVPVGGIIMWSGSIATIPQGWYICDGNNGTPDLRDRFVLGAGLSYNVAAAGGSKDAVVVAHTHSLVNSGSHVHYFNRDYDGNFGGGGGNAFIGDNSNNNIYDTKSMQAAGDHTHTVNSAGTAATNANMPPYYALAFIMKGAA